MKSIRFYLIATILSAMTLLVFLSVLHGYQKSSDELKGLLDKQLVDMANMLSILEITPKNYNSISQKAETTNTAFQIWQGKKLISRSNNAPDSLMTNLQAGFQDSNFSRYRWRNYVLYNSITNRWIITAERTDIRNSLIDSLILESVLPIIIMLPTALIIIWSLVGSGLKPIKQLTRQLQQKQEHDLSPVSLPDALKELQPLIDSTNSLLTRLGNAFEREKKFSADAAHELRTPISVLKVDLYNLQSEFSDNKNLKKLTAGVDRMGHVVEQILSLYRTAPDQHMVNFEPLDLYEMAQYCIANQYSDFEDKNQQVELSGCSAWMQGDKFTIETLLRNLLSNANKYTPEEGCVDVTVDVDDKNVLLQIDDSGPGIPIDMYGRVFDRFYRMNGDQHSSGIVGCGLGLSIVQHIIQLHHGSIQLSHSKYPTGLAITIIFPLLSPSNEK